MTITRGGMSYPGDYQQGEGGVGVQQEWNYDYWSQYSQYNYAGNYPATAAVGSREPMYRNVTFKVVVVVVVYHVTIVAF